MKSLNKVTKDDKVKCRKARFPVEQLDFALTPASEIIDPLVHLTQKYSKCVRFDQYQNLLWKLQGAVLRVLQTPNRV